MIYLSDLIQVRYKILAPDLNDLGKEFKIFDLPKK